MRRASHFEFGEYRFQPDTPLLTRGGRRLELAPKALAVLASLIRNAGQAVSKDALLQEVWPNAEVEEANLAVHVSALRKALGDGYIETIPRLGYRFIIDLPHGRVLVADSYLRQQTAEGCRRAAAEYRQILRTDPRNPAAKAGLANSLLLRLVLGDLSAGAAVPRAQNLLDDAVCHDPSNSGVRLSRSRLLSLGEWKWPQAGEELDRAHDLAGDPTTRATINAWQGLHQLERGDPDRGLRLLDQAYPPLRYPRSLLDSAPMATSSRATSRHRWRPPERVSTFIRIAGRSTAPSHDRWPCLVRLDRREPPAAGRCCFTAKILPHYTPSSRG